MSENIFAKEWVECLEAHYMHVIRINDKVTEPSLSIVMHNAGFSDAQLAELRVRATMRADQVADDFVPDLDILDAHDHEPIAEPVEAQVYNIPIDVAPASAEVTAPEEVEAVSVLDDQPEVVEVVSPIDDQPEAALESDIVEDEVMEEPDAEDPDAPQQLSLF